MRVYIRGRMLDPSTTLFATALSTTTCGLVLLVCRQREGNVPLRTCAMATVFAAAGLTVRAAAASRPGLVDTIGVAILLFAAALFWTAIRRFRGAPAHWAAAAAGPAAWIATATLQTHDPAWTALSCGIGTAYTVASARELLFLRAERLPTWLPVMALTVGHAGIYSVRIALALGEALAPGSVTTPDWIDTALLAEAMIHINGSTIVLVALSREYEERRASVALRRAAYQDGLTGIANRRRFDERLDELAGDRRRRTTSLGLIMIDLDRFKSVNDTVGHSEGDRILRTVAGIIEASVRPDTDLAARYGGEEFAVIVAGSTLDALRQMAERIRSAVETAAIPHPATGGVVTISLGIGLAAPGELGRYRQDFLSRTDQALYQAKQLGRNRVHAAEPWRAQGVISWPRPVRAA